MRHRARLVFLVLAVLAVAPPSALASSAAIPIHVTRGLDLVSGPVFAGDAVAFGRPTEGGYEVVVRRGAQAAIARVAVPGLEGAYRTYVFARLEASSKRFALGLAAWRCDSRALCDEEVNRRLYRATLTGDLAGGRLTIVDGCTSEAQCRAKQCLGRPELDVSGDAVAFVACSGGIGVRDLAPGANPSARSYPDPAWGPRLAGDFVASEDTTGANAVLISVRNWRSGQDAYSVEADYPTTIAADHPTYDLQADGKVFYPPTTDGHAWASPSEPFEHTVDTDPLFTTRARIASDRGAYATDIDASPLDVPGSRFVVRDLNDPPPPDAPNEAPALATSEDTHAVGSMDFDGSRLAWIVRVCRHKWISVWDLADQRPPALPRVPCPIPSAVSGSARVDQQHRFHVTLECPASPDVGCVGLVAAKEPSGASWRRYSIPAGATQTKQLSSSAPCRDSSGRARAKLLFSRGYYHGEPPVVKTTTVTVHGATGSLRRC